ncbi:MAG: hypothetical protein JWM47_2960 [Acidimicrobiales bacterium]|nr:hypothetical protein [Acidimicrobiales bacterium]
MGTVVPDMPNDPLPARDHESLELPVEEVLRRARPLPPHSEMVIDDLSDEEGEAFLATIAT